MRELLSYDPLAPILLDAHYEAMDRRLVHILDVLEDCMQKAGAEKVLVKDAFSALWRHTRLWRHMSVVTS